MSDHHLPVHVRARNWDIRIAPRTMWTAAFIALTCAALIYVLMHAFQILALLFIAITFAEGIRPVVTWLRQHHIPRPLGTLIVYIVLFGVLFGLGYIMARPVVAQIANLINALPTYMQGVQQWLQHVQHMLKSNALVSQVLQGVQSQGSSLVGGLVGTLLGVPVVILNGLFSLVIVLTMAFIWVNGVGPLRPFIIGLLPDAVQEQASNILEKAGHRLSWYVRGVLVNMLFIGITHAVGLFMLGVPYPLLLGIFAGFTEVIPFVGPFVAGAVSIAVGLFSHGLLKGLEVFVLVLLIQQFESNILVPNVMNRVVKLHPLTVIVAVVLGGSMAGILGAILAVPVAILVHITVTDVLAPLAHRVSHPQEVAALPPPPETPPDQAELPPPQVAQKGTCG